MYAADIDDSYTFNNIVKQNEKILISPRKWSLFYTLIENPEMKSNENLTDVNSDINAPFKNIDKGMRDVERRLEGVYIGINTEVYVAFEDKSEIIVYLVYQIRQHLPIIWELYGVWRKNVGFDRPHPDAVLAMRRRDLRGLRLVTATVLSNRTTTFEMENYIDREVDIPIKMVYHMSMNLFDWLNSVGVLNVCSSYGYRQADGKFDGVVREMADGRSEFAATSMFVIKDRMDVVNYVTAPSPGGTLLFIFKKPPLATVANIYALPFSRGVWYSLLALITVSAVALTIASFGETRAAEHEIPMTFSQRLSQGFHDTFCLVFQQGAMISPMAASSRQVLLIGLLSFMFLYTAYSANVVALLQSATNEINSVESILNSPLEIGADDMLYNKQVFVYETRPIHRELYLKKGVPRGDDFFIPIEEGIRRVRKGLFAFHVQTTGAYDHIQKTFMENEKCNLGTVKFISYPYPHFGITKTSHIKEPVRIGVARLMESGVQSRTTRRVMATKPTCAGAAMFTPVSLLYVTPVFKQLLIIYAAAVAILVLEIFVHRQVMKRKSTDHRENITSANNEDEVYIARVFQL
ncbi:hypothetical protein JYU34_012121 [Plutella xylostella]|uniref:Uncharacterized protein n=1 Tax=Plutella xylostella TaxID=51655 RepID=A0ABQ7QEG4_PLUXY|nr:hypothetical protein JYU34_012121 [Plutella xylostella]